MILIQHGGNVVIIIKDADRYYPAELIGGTGRAVLPPPQFWISVKKVRKLVRRHESARDYANDGWLPNSFKSAKNARRCARRRFGAGNLAEGMWQAHVQRGQRLQVGHLVSVSMVV